MESNNGAGSLLASSARFFPWAVVLSSSGFAASTLPCIFFSSSCFIGSVGRLNLNS